MLSNSNWINTSVICDGFEAEKHHPVPMAYERDAGILVDGAIFRCTLCNRTKFVWRTPLIKTIRWKWSVW